jgi:predicted transcriptional regulator
MAKKTPDLHLSRRERQAMDIIYECGQVTAAELLERLPDPPSYSAVRSMLRLLEEKGHLEHAQDGPRYVFSPTVPRERASQSALRHVLKTFFDGSTEDAVAALLGLDSDQIDEAAAKRMVDLIKRAKQEGR